MDLILLNCQVPRERLSDFRAQMAANRLGVQRLQGLCAKYGRETVLQAGSALQDYAERKMRAGIAAIPDGVYRFADRYDCPEVDGELDLSCEITVRGDSMQLHFEAPPQVRAGLNMTMTALLSTVYYAVKAIVDPTILPNAGLARPLSVTAPVRNGGELLASGGGERPAVAVPACRRPDLRGARAGRAAAGDGGVERRVFLHHVRRTPAKGQRALGLSGNDRRRVRRALEQGWPGRRACPHDQHLQPAGRGIGAGISADPDAL